MSRIIFFVGFLIAPRSDACAFVENGEQASSLWAGIHQRALNGMLQSEMPSLIPDRLSTKGNAFTSRSLLRPAMPTGGSKLLADELIDFAANQSEQMCYWSFQPLAPPKGQGQDLLHPSRHHWDIECGQHDEDLEWQGALSSAASARLKRIQVLSNGTLVSTMCASGRDVAQRRCKNGRTKTDTWQDQCTPAIYNQEIRWGMAVTIWKIDSNLKHWVRYWRSNNSFGHTPNIQWTFRGGTQPTHPWNHGAPLPSPEQIDPEGEPHGPLEWPSSKGKTWGAGDGASMLAKVLPCSQVPKKFQYPREQYYCDHINEDASQTTADEAYEYWKTVTSLWPPTKPCTDNVTKLNEIMGGRGPPTQFGTCSDAMAFLHKTVDNFNCDAITFGRFQFREVCCSECGSQPIPDLPASPAPVPPPAGEAHSCGMCGHRYDAEEDGGGSAFEDLPDSWRCPICGLPKAAYKKTSASQYFIV